MRVVVSSLFRTVAGVGVALGLLSAALSLAIAPAVHAQQSNTSSGTQVSRDIILQRLADPESLGFQVRQRAKSLTRYYSDPASRMLWEDQERSDQFLRRLRNADQDGLDPSDYPIDVLVDAKKLNRFALSGEAQLRQGADAELYWSSIFLKYAADLKVGRFLPTKIEPQLYWQQKSIDMVSALNLLAALGSIDDFFNAWQPQIPDYRSLRLALAEYRAIAAKGGWPAVPVADVLKPGARSPNVPALRNRLSVTEDAPLAAPAGEEDLYGDDLVASVQRFQHRHGLDDDGIIGNQTYLQLNIPVDDRIRQIVMNMERWRWMPEDLGKHYIIVNIAGYELRRVQATKLVERMRVVVGQPYHQTPVFSETMTYVELNPYWNVPYSIAVNEMLPKLQGRAGSLMAQGYEAVVNDKPVALTSIDWRQYSKGHFPVQLRQRPGSTNALGYVKFMFPNRFNVYMHDTPSRSLFGETTRAFSHGCIRLARPIDMAEQVLGTVEGWDRGRIEKVLAAKQRTVVSLSSPIQVHITYATAWRDAGGDIQFRPDIYQRDTRLYAALFGKKYPY
ncbi:MAG: murein L,D-transpeptidase [Hyphomicrobiaceae bacterium]